MRRFILTLIAATLPITPVLAGERLPHEATYHPDQLQPPAGLDHLYVYRPACRQLEKQRSDVAGWAAWGMKDTRGKFMPWYGLEAHLSDSEAYQWLAAAGLCVVNGAIADMMSPTEHQALLAGSSPAAAMDEPTAAAIAADPLLANRQRAQQLRAGTDQPTTGDSSGSIIMLVVLAIAGYMSFPAIKEWAAELRQGLNEPLDPRQDNVPLNLPDASHPAPSDQRTALEILLHSPNISRAIYGAQRSGKTNLAATASRILKNQGYAIFHINLGSFGDEDQQYWQHADRTVTCDLLNADAATGVQAIKQAEAVVQAFAQHPAKALLLVDEWKFITNKSNRFVDALESLVNAVSNQVSGLDSSGVKRAKAIWTMAPGIVAKTSVPAGLCVKNLNACLVAIPPGKYIEWNGQKITFSHEVLDQVSNNYGAVSYPAGEFHSDRICFIDGEWRPLGGQELTQYLPNKNVPLMADSTPVGIPQGQILMATEQKLFPGIDVFVGWLETKKQQTINYTDFRNANRCRDLNRSQENFIELCDAAILKGLLTPKGNGDFFVLP